VSSATISDLGGGVWQVTQPLPWALDHVHCYCLRDGDGCTIIDTGLGTPGTLRRWIDALRAIGAEPVRRIIITHYHPDHNGSSGPLAAVTRPAEIIQGRIDHAGTWPAFLDPSGPERFERYLATLGMPRDVAAGSAADERDMPYHPADPTRLVDEQDGVEIQGERFRVLHLPGHADGHIVLFGETTGRLFGGDVLLNEITPNVGLWEDATRPDPLADYLTSLMRIETLAPRIVYPGHRTLITDAATRARAIRAHHAARLDTHQAALAAGASTPYEVGRVVWAKRLGFHEQRFAIAEAAAHLAHLVTLGRARTTPAGGYTTA
jgi:glyoxylase-like metal-dependent hydrolase (beta-lactamase superfamily II)